MTTIGSSQPFGRRRRVLAWLMAVPTVMTALGMSALEGWRFARPLSPLFVTPRVDSLADAIAIDDVMQAYGFIRSGKDPNGLISARHAVLTGGRWVRVSPVLWAVGTASRQSLPMLLAFGAHFDPNTQRRAICLARYLGYEDIQRSLEPFGELPSTEPCPRQETREATVLALLTEP